MTEQHTIQQLLQEEEYAFPYHYVAQYKGGDFRHFFLDNWAINYASTMEYLLGKMQPCAAARIVDIGCGDGRFSREMSLAFGCADVVGVDHSSAAIALASAMNSTIKGLEFHLTDITKKHDLGSFDIAVLMEVFEHIPLESCESFMASVHALLRRGGTLYLVVPHENKPLEYKHFQHFSVASIRDYMSPHFEIVEVVPFEKRSPLRGLLLKLLSNRFFILHHPYLLQLLYRRYKKHLFFCESEKECQRIFVKALAK